MQNKVDSIYTPEHKKARSELEYYIPSDLALKFLNTDFGKINKEARELLAEISLRIQQKDSQSEMLFAKILEYNKTKYSGKVITEKEKEFLGQMGQEGERGKKELENSLLLNILYEKGILDSNRYVRQGTAQSLGELAKVNPDLYISLYEKGILDSDSDVRKATAQSLGELAKVNPDLYISLYEKGILDSDSDVRYGTAQSLGELAKVIDYEEFKKFQKVMKDLGIEEKNKTNFINNFSYYVLGNKELKFKDEIKKAIQNFDILFEFSQKQNDSQELEDKKVKNVEKWWEENNLKIVNLMSLDQNKARDLLSSLIAQGLPKTESALKLYSQSLSDGQIKEILNQIIKKDIKNQINGNMLGILLETSAGFKNMNAIDVFQKTVKDFFEKNQNKAFDIIDLQSELSKKMLKILAKEVGIEGANIKSQDLGKWDLVHLPHLITNAEMIKEEGESGEDQLELYKAILKACFEDRFDQFLIDLNQKDKIGRDVARHNQKVKENFKKLGIDWNEWSGFASDLSFDLVSEKEKENLSELFGIIRDRFADFSEKLTANQEKSLSALSNALVKDIQLIEKSKKNLGSIVKNINTIEELLAQLLPSFTKSLEYLKNKAQKEGKEFELSNDISESYSHLLESLQLLVDTKQKPRESNLQKERFTVRKWKRDSKTDFFQGNHTHCCIAVGIKPGQQVEGLHTHHPETIQQYLVDQGIQVVEVVDQEGIPIAQTWVFVSEDSGSPIMVMDNFEINAKYSLGKPGNTLIKENVFKFMKLYAQRCGIDKVVLGNVSTNDIGTENLTKANIQSINKIGGYLWDERYYLEALGQSNPHLVAEQILGTRKKRERKETLVSNGFFSTFNINTGNIEETPYTQELVNQIMSGESDLASEADLEALERIEETKFAQAGLSNATSDLEDILEGLKNTKGIQMLFRNDAGSLVGYLSSKPAPDAKANILSAGMSDPEFPNNPKTLYIESIAGTIGKENYAKILENLKEQARRAGYTRLCLHGINPKLNASLKTLGFEKIRDVDDWIGGYSAEYMEMEV